MPLKVNDAGSVDIFASCVVPRLLMMFASYSGSCNYGRSDQSGRQKLKLNHSASPLLGKAALPTLFGAFVDRKSNIELLDFNH
jgi:hypothetical protein